jgi:SAM-dependent methyltransferase
MEKPILDLACGCGHLSHYLTNCESRHSAIGFDPNFHQLWTARNLIAPKAAYVCGDIADGLPFADDTLGAVVCSDAFHYFQKKPECLAEMRRCATDGVLILTRVGNLLVKPNEGRELSPDQYGELLGQPGLRAFGEDALIDRYLRRVGPDLSSPTPLESLRDVKWLSFVLSHDERILREHIDHAEWPHAVGHLGLNPIYVGQKPSLTGEIQYRFQFPSPWYELENQRMREYHRESFVVNGKFLQELASGISSSEVEELVAGFAVVGLPTGYV